MMQLQSIASILCLTPNAVKMWCIVSLPVECGDTLCLCKPNVVTHIVSLRVLRSVDVLLQTAPCGSRFPLIVARFKIQTLVLHQLLQLMMMVMTMMMISKE